MKIFKNMKWVLACMMLFVLASCDKTKPYDVIVPPGQANFANQTLLYYFVKNDPSTQFKLPIGLTAASSTPVTLTIGVTSPTGAVEGTHYTIPSKTITIAAGKALDSLVIKAIPTQYFANNRVDTLKVFFTNLPSGYSKSTYNDTLRIVLRKYCNVVGADFLGNFTRSVDMQGATSYTPYTAQITSFTLTSATTATAVIKNVWDVGGTTNVVFDWTDPANFKTTIPAQFLYTDAQYGAATITGVGTGTFSSCDNTVNLSYKVTVAAGSFGNFITTMKR